MTDARRQGMSQSRSGVISMFVGVVANLPDAQISEHNKMIMLTALAENATLLSQVLTLPQRQQVLQAVQNTQPHTSATLQPLLGKVADALKDSHCTGLCAI
jgi:hypothetical protein